ncbi:MAG: hypothetical protein HXX80_01765 [Nitrososphaerales archaeon]|nr:hypothetical protein [Nitrososphaerales archaeon]
MYKEITQKIIDLLKAHADLICPTKIKEYHFGAPVTFAKVRYPAIYVQFNGRRVSGKANVNQFLYDLVFEIGVADRSVKEDDAEKSVYDKAEAIDSVLRDNPTLDGLVSDMRLARDIEVVHATESDYAVAIARVIHVARKWMN